MDSTCAESVRGIIVTSATPLPDSIRMIGFFSTFLYHWVSDPFTGKR